jgi:hypothetical protein
MNVPSTGTAGLLGALSGKATDLRDQFFLFIVQTALLGHVAVIFRPLQFLA